MKSAASAAPMAAPLLGAPAFAPVRHAQPPSLLAGAPFDNGATHLLVADAHSFGNAQSRMEVQSALHVAPSHL